MTDEGKIFNTRTNRYVTKGSTAYRRMISEDRREQAKKDAELKKLNAKTESIQSDPILEKVKSKTKSKSKPKEKVSRKQDEKAVSELTSLSMKVIKDNEKEFRKIRGNQSETDKLLKKLLYEKLAKKESKKESRGRYKSPKKSRPRSILDDLASLSYDTDSSYSS